jgi:capsular polysaccharide biosynthesis protein
MPPYPSSAERGPAYLHILQKQRKITLAELQALTRLELLMPEFDRYLAHVLKTASAGDQLKALQAVTVCSRHALRPSDTEAVVRSLRQLPEAATPADLVGSGTNL